MSNSDTNLKSLEVYRFCFHVFREVHSAGNGLYLVSQLLHCLGEWPVPDWQAVAALESGRPLVSVLSDLLRTVLNHSKRLDVIISWAWFLGIFA